MAKYSDVIQLIQAEPLLVRNEHAAQMVAGEQNLRRLVSAGWISPIIKHSGCTAYALADLRAAVTRAKDEGWPDKSAA